MLKPRAGTEAEKSSSCMSELGIFTTSGKGGGKLSQEAMRTYIEAHIQGRVTLQEVKGPQDGKEKFRCWVRGMGMTEIMS